VSGERDVSRAGGIASCSRFAAWKNSPSVAGLTMAASAGVRRAPVSRLFDVGVCRSLIAYSGPPPIRTTAGLF
jgi:hypothetical protein